jgi:ribosomal protein S18 acetylase RimI-like enzyme
MAAVEIRRLTPHDWRLFRQVRLAALAESPEAFGSSLAREQAYAEQQWRDWMRPDRGLKSVAMAGGAPVGVVGAWLPPDRGGAVELFSMWVSPTARRRGVGAALVAEVLDWAGGQRHRAVELWVVEDNDTARRLYGSFGFQPTGETQPHPNDPRQRERLMCRTLE